jgi:O-antigen ligase
MLMLGGVARSLFIPAAILGVTVMGYALVGDAVGDRVASVYASELKVLQGHEDSDRAFHGRMYIWKSYLRRWSDTSLLTKLVGISAADQEELAPTPRGQVQVMINMVLAGIHNDYLRIMFSAGLIGLTLYFLFFVLVIVSGMGANVAERFLIITASAIVFLYSVTTLPTLYAPCLYLYMPVFAYAARLRENRIACRSVPAKTGPLRAVTHRA